MALVFRVQVVVDCLIYFVMAMPSLLGVAADFSAGIESTGQASCRGG